MGIVELKDGGASGALVAVLRSVNKVPDNVGSVSPSGGAMYDGAERSDIHDTVVIFKETNNNAAEEKEEEVVVEDQERENSKSGADFGTSLCFMTVIALVLSMHNI